MNPIKTLHPNKIKTIGVFVEKDLIGESLLKLPFLQALRKAFPETHITWIVGIGSSPYASVLKPLVKDFLNQVIENAFPKKMRWRDLIQKNNLLPSFDMIINTENNLKKTLILKRTPHSFFVCSLHSYLYSSLKPLNKKYKYPLHLTEKLLDLVDVAAQKKIQRNSFLVSMPSSISEKVSSIFDPKLKYIGLVPGAGNRKKCWPLEYFMELSSFIRTKNFVPVWILGPQENDMYEQLSTLCPGDIFPLQHYPSFTQSPLYTIAIAKFLTVCVSNDSGAGHLLAAGGCPIISLFGHTKAEKVHPFSSSVIIIKSTDFGSADIRTIPAEAVKLKLSSFLD